ncbi:uncharacterized protein GLRG_09150 [Colletotrichum graminicola M1.001]|uniref:Uncharacterized protein n=1 Tax=Colletotrichum graminicola (strain M1.001 / M2 / FGSC 10212) TaxID=645133 RepID=E3QT18_COLGM|nr:uncharacterized protein GLRG_09150 [Colletotrichum graminicola M1.001]EFQ34006.1 hypothetical protein GLRG_09150 [Colletotrichum graminicola M1.001]
MIVRRQRQGQARRAKEVSTLGLTLWAGILLCGSYLNESGEQTLHSSYGLGKMGEVSRSGGPDCPPRAVENPNKYPLARPANQSSWRFAGNEHVTMARLLPTACPCWKRTRAFALYTQGNCPPLVFASLRIPFYASYVILEQNKQNFVWTSRRTTGMETTGKQKIR